jgi:hypothetical protein
MVLSIFVTFEVIISRIRIYNDAMNVPDGQTMKVLNEFHDFADESIGKVR